MYNSSSSFKYYIYLHHKRRQQASACGQKLKECTNYFLYLSFDIRKIDFPSVFFHNWKIDKGILLHRNYFCVYIAIFLHHVEIFPQGGSSDYLSNLSFCCSRHFFLGKCVGFDFHAMIAVNLYVMMMMMLVCICITYISGSFNSFFFKLWQH